MVADVGGTIKMVTANVTRMFGYKKQDLIGKDVSIFMPQPLASHHPQILKNTDMEPGREVRAWRWTRASVALPWALASLRDGLAYLSAAR